MLHIPCLSPSVSYYSKKPCFFNCRMVFPNQNLGSGGAHCSYGVNIFRTSWQTVIILLVLKIFKGFKLILDKTSNTKPATHTHIYDSHFSLCPQSSPFFFPLVPLETAFVLLSSSLYLFTSSPFLNTVPPCLPHFLSFNPRGHDVSLTLLTSGCLSILNGSLHGAHIYEKSHIEIM